MRFLRDRFARFGKNEGGTVLTETILILPILIWAYIGLFTYWDAYRSLNVTQKASYTVADMISRFDTIDPNTFLPGLKKVMTYLIDDNETAEMRVTAVTWSDARHRFEVIWSRTTDTRAFPALTTSTLQEKAPQIPTTVAGDWTVIVETWVDFVPAFDLSSIPFASALPSEPFYQFIATRPRAGRTCLTNMSCS